MAENTLLGRCAVALSEAYEQTGPFDEWPEICAAAMLEHLAAELLVMKVQNGSELTAREIAQRFVQAADETDEPADENDHGSLSVAERNSSLR